MSTSTTNQVGCCGVMHPIPRIPYRLPCCGKVLGIPEPAPRPRPALHTPLPITQRILSVMRQSRQVQWHYRELAHSIEDIPAQKVGEACVRLAHQGRLVEVKLGTYRLPVEVSRG